jgi:hypothetical protein
VGPSEALNPWRKPQNINRWVNEWSALGDVHRHDLNKHSLIFGAVTGLTK